MKKILMICICVFTCLGLVGCSGNIDKEKNINYIEIEEANYTYDKTLLTKAKEIYDKNIKRAKNKSELQVVTIKYADDIYQIAANRVNLDLEICMVFSKDYKDYIQEMKSYSEIYLAERTNLVNNKTIQNNNDLHKTKIGESLKDIVK